MLDTSVVVRLFRDAEGAVAAKLSAYEECFLPQTALGELYAGAYRSAQVAKNLRQSETFLDAVSVMTPDAQTAEHYGRLSAALAQAGRTIRKMISGSPLSRCNATCRWPPATPTSTRFPD